MGNRPELLSPAGDPERLQMAVRYGADAVYLAGKSYGMRAKCGNFSDEELREAVRFCAEHDMEISFTSPGWVDASFCHDLGINAPTCGACLSNMAVTPSGKVVACQSWLNGPVLGDMLTDSWEDIWYGDRCRTIRSFSAKMTGECPLRKQANGDEPPVPSEIPQTDGSEEVVA